MAHFAQIDDNNIVIRVLVVPDEEEYRGNQYLSSDLLLGGAWIQCSYNGKIRKQYPGQGFSYDPVADVFIAPQPYPSWNLDSNHDWQPPVPMPDTPSRWNEDVQQWEDLHLTKTGDIANA